MRDEVRLTTRALMSLRFLSIPFAIWGLLALGVALLFVFVWPSERVGDVRGFRFIVLCWSHALVWLLLALSFFARGANLPNLANPIALLAGLTYLLFIVTLISR
jgi:hypothetical protein